MTKEDYKKQEENNLMQEKTVSQPIISDDEEEKKKKEQDKPEEKILTPTSAVWGKQHAVEPKQESLTESDKKQKDKKKLTEPTFESKLEF